mmetsp:Transcript_8008/g.26818  ORF Transcript_8008/g.26818 Transcript_8008/m.26818 type:complete len:95 (-) Transcript_8008:10-294(-)
MRALTHALYVPKFHARALPPESRDSFNPAPSLATTTTTTTHLRGDGAKVPTIPRVFSQHRLFTRDEGVDEHHGWRASRSGVALGTSSRALAKVE